MEPTEYLEHLRDDGQALAAAAQPAPRAAVPSCPAWDMTELVAHTGGVHRWVAGIVKTAPTERPRKELSPPTEPAAVLRWYEDGLAQLLDVLSDADPEAPVWNWLAREPAPTRFWYRRMAHETAVHRWDAQAAAGASQPIDAVLAVDGIDEFLLLAARRLPTTPIEGFAGSLHLHATDVEGEWSLFLRPNQLEHRPEHTKADAAIRGSASDLFLWATNRVPADSAQFELFGDRAIVDAWRALKFE